MKQRNRHLDLADFEYLFGVELAPYLDESRKLDDAAWSAMKRGDNPMEDPSVLQQAARIAEIEASQPIGPNPPSTQEAIIAGSFTVQLFLQEQSNNANTSGIIV